MLDCPLQWGPTILDGFVSGTIIGLGSMLKGALMLQCLTFWNCLPRDLFVHIEDFRADTLCHFDPLSHVYMGTWGLRFAKGFILAGMNFPKHYEIAQI